MVSFSEKTQANPKKKTLRSSQAGTEEKLRQRQEYWERIKDVAEENLVFIDEMGILLGLMRLYGRSQQGERLYEKKPFYHGKKVTVMGAISQNKILALKSLNKSMKGEDFREFVKNELIPQLWEGAVVVMDNLKAHKVKGIREMIERAGARVVYLSPYSPDFNPIEHLWWQLKAFIRRFVPKTVTAVEQLLNLGWLLCGQQELRNYFAHCCYCTS